MSFFNLIALYMYFAKFVISDLFVVVINLSNLLSVGQLEIAVFSN